MVERKSSFEVFGVECGEGWRGLYAPLIDLCSLMGNEVLQVKEKFGLLRFYYSGPYDMQLLVDAAETKSGSVCEECGESRHDWDWGENGEGTKPKATRGTSKTSGWIRTLCYGCREAWDFKRAPLGNKVRERW